MPQQGVQEVDVVEGGGRTDARHQRRDTGIPIRPLTDHAAVIPARARQQPGKAQRGVFGPVARELAGKELHQRWCRLAPEVHLKSHFAIAKKKPTERIQDAGSPVKAGTPSR